MPSFTEASMTFCARALRLRTAPEDVFANPAIYPFALFNKALLAWRTLDCIRDVQLLFRSAAHWVPFEVIRRRALRRATWWTEDCDAPTGGNRRLSERSLSRSILPVLRQNGTVGAQRDVVRLTELDKGLGTLFQHHPINLVERRGRRPVVSIR
jgi:hypothetical protein